MKLRSTTPQLRRFVTTTMLVASAVMMVVSSPMGVLADRFDDQIRELESEVTRFDDEASRLSQEADTLKNKIARLNAQKKSIQTQIDLNESKRAKLVDEIAANEKKLGEQQLVLGSTLGDLYVGDTTSPIEMLASSKNIGDYIDQAEYQSSIRDNLQDSITEIQKLKEELAEQKKTVEQVISDQEARKSELARKESEQATLLEETRGQEAAYRSLISSRNSQISDLRAEQAAANAAAAQQYSVSNLSSGGAGCGGYPAVWCNAAQDSLVDNWGMYNRECVSYTAWKVAATGRHMPYWGGRGNANEWPSSAAASGIPTGSTPKVGSVAIMYIGPYGHSMYVEGVNGDGTIRVSQFNWGVRGEYSEMTISSSGLTYIYF